MSSNILKLTMQKDSELIKKLRYEYRLTQQEFADKVGVTKSYIGLIETAKSPLSQKIRNKINEIFEINNQKNSNLLISAKFYTDVIGSCGNGAFEQSQNYEIVEIPSFLINDYCENKEYSIITAKGDSMNPTIISGDKLLIENYNNEGIIDDNIYIFCYSDGLYIKRLVKNIDQIIVKSDNNTVPTRYIEKEDMNNIYIIGRIVGSLRNYLNN